MRNVYAIEFPVVIVVLGADKKGLLRHMGTDGQPTNRPTDEPNKTSELREAQVDFL
jgi:hypothetical protein